MNDIFSNTGHRTAIIRQILGSGGMDKYKSENESDNELFLNKLRSYFKQAGPLRFSYSNGNKTNEPPWWQPV